MTAIYAKHAPYEDGHLGEVYHEMQLAGAPTIRAVEFNDALYALEGSHRLAACHELGLRPKVFVRQPDTGGADEFFERVGPDLPRYDFDFVLALPETAFL